MRHWAAIGVFDSLMFYKKILKKVMKLLGASCETLKLPAVKIGKGSMLMRFDLFGFYGFMDCPRTLFYFSCFGIDAKMVEN